MAAAPLKIELVKTIRGKDKATFQGFVYTLTKSSLDVQQWVCENPGTKIPGRKFLGTNIPGTKIPRDEKSGTKFPGRKFLGTNIPGTKIPRDEKSGTKFPGFVSISFLYC